MSFMMIIEKRQLECGDDGYDGYDYAALDSESVVYRDIAPRVGLDPLLEGQDMQGFIVFQLPCLRQW